VIGNQVIVAWELSDSITLTTVQTARPVRRSRDDEGGRAKKA